MIDPSPVTIFVNVCRNFGLSTAMRVTYFRVRGKLIPALALPDPSAYSSTPRGISVLLEASEHPAAALETIVGIIANRPGWQMCISQRPPIQSDMAHLLGRLRGTQPWIRIVADWASVDDATAAQCTAAQWAVEQALGRFVAFVAPRYTPNAAAFDRLLARLHDDPGMDAAILTGMDSGSAAQRTDDPSADCRLLLQRKSAYLATFSGHYLLTAPNIARALHETKIPIAYLPAETA